MIFAIDPGNEQSAYVAFDGEKILAKDKVDNRELRNILRYNLKVHKNEIKYTIEMIASYGMPVGKDVFETAVWIGRFFELVKNYDQDMVRVYRKDIKMHLCGTTKAKDSNIIQALVDKYAPGENNKGKGTKANPGFFYGFKKDIWQAFALADYYYETKVKK